MSDPQVCQCGQNQTSAASRAAASERRRARARRSGGRDRRSQVRVFAGSWPLRKKRLTLTGRMPPRSSGAQELGAQLQEQVESLRSSSRAAASRAERSLRAELAEARAEAALLRHELLQAEEAHAAAVEAGRVRRTASRVVENWRRHAALERSHGGVAAQLRRRMREADEQEAARLQQAALMRRELAQAEEAIAERDDARSQLREATAERDDARAQLRELLEHVRRADERADGDAAAIARLAELASSSQQALLESLNEIVELKRSTPRRRGRRRPDDDDGDGGGGGGDSGVPRTSLEGIGGSGGGDEKVCVVAWASTADGVDSHGGKWIWRHERAADQLPRVADGVVDETAVDRTTRGAADISRSRETPGLQRRRAQNPRVANGAAQRERRTRRVLAGERRVRRAARVAAAAARRRVRRLVRPDRRAVCGRAGAAHRRSRLGGGARADGRRGGRGFSLRRRARLRQLLHPRRRIVSRPIRIPTSNLSPGREPSSKTEAPSRRAAASRRGAGGADGRRK